MKRSRDDVSSDNKGKKKKKLDASVKQQSASAINTKEIPRKVQTSKSTTATPVPDPLFAGITKKIMSNNRASPPTAKASAATKVPKASHNANIKGKGNETSQKAKEKPQNKKVPTVHRQEESSDSDSSSNTSSGVGSLSSVEKEIAAYMESRQDAKLAKPISKGREGSTSPDTSSDDGEPISFVRKQPASKTTGTSIERNRQEKAKPKTVHEVSPSSSPMAALVTVRRALLAGPMDEGAGRRDIGVLHVSTSSGSSSSSDSEAEDLGSFVKKLPHTMKKNTVPSPATSGASRGHEKGSKSGSETKQKSKRCISKATISDDSSDSNSSSEQQRASNVSCSRPETKQKSKRCISKAMISDDSSDSNSSPGSDSDTEPVSFVTPSRPAKVQAKSSTRAAPERSAAEPEKCLSDPSYSRNAALKKTPASGSNSLGGAEFRKQPPMCIRKMNIIDMELSFYDAKGKPVEIKKACFVGFMESEDEPSEERTRNGIHYRIKTLLSDDTHHSEDIYLRVVDGRDGSIIRYEGNERNEDLQRVLLTHAATCARCQLKQTCGTRAKTPECSVTHDGKAVKFHVRCNTTCAVSHGGRIGKQNNRTFKFVFSSMPNITEDSTLASSIQVNVHHNTKMKRLLNEGFNPFTREWGEPLPVV